MREAKTVNCGLPVQVDSMLTETKVVDQYPGVFEVCDHEMGRELWETDNTPVGINDSWTCVFTTS